MIDVELLRINALRPGPTGRYLEKAVDGEPFFLQADTAWELCYRLSREEVLEYLDTRKDQGFNALLTVLLPELDVKPARTASGAVFGPDGRHNPNADDSKGTNIFYPSRYGETPLVNDDPYQPNETYFTHVDWVLEQALRRGIVPVLVPTWARFLNGGWQGGPILFDDKSSCSYGAFIGKRYPYLLKILGGDSNPVWTDAPQIWSAMLANGRKKTDLPLPSSDDLPRMDFHSVVNAMAAGITSSESVYWEGLGTPLITYHPTALWMNWSPKATASNFFGNEPWLTLDGCQSGHADFPNIPFEPAFGFWNSRASHEPLSQMWNSGKIRPLIDLESHYEGMHNGLDGTDPKIWDGHDIRTGAWQSVLSGACGVVYGTNGIWQMYDKDQAKVSTHYKAVCGLSDDASWREELSLPGPSYLAHLSAFFRSLPCDLYHRLQPSQSLLISSSAPAQIQQLDGRVDIMSDSAFGSGNASLLIAHSGYGYSFELDLRAAFSENEMLSATWLDPRTGTTHPAWSVKAESKVVFDPPSFGSAEHDWVLLVKTIHV